MMGMEALGTSGGLLSLLCLAVATKHTQRKNNCANPGIGLGRGAYSKEEQLHESSSRHRTRKRHKLIETIVRLPSWQRSQGVKEEVIP